MSHALYQERPVERHCQTMDALTQLKAVDAKLTLHYRQLAESDYVSEYFFHLPWPAWVKSLDGKVIAMNPAYSTRYGAEKDDIEVFWPEEARRAFGENDREVARTGRASTYVERISNPKTGQLENLTVVKFPVYSGPDLVGVGGFAIYLPT